MAKGATGRRRELDGIGATVQAAALNLCFYPLMTMWVLVGIAAAPFCLLAWKLATRWDWGRIVRHLIHIHGSGLVAMVSPFVRFRPEGTDRIERPCIMVVNHLSFFDSYFMAALPFTDIIFAVGAWPFRMYWYTLFMRLARYLDVENRPWSELVGICRESFAGKGTVLFFPEGHRSRSGELQPFYSGAFRLARETGIPVVPLCLTGTDRMLPPGEWYLHPAQVRLKVLAPVDPAAFTGPFGHLAMRRQVRDLMQNALEEMRGEPCRD